MRSSEIRKRMRILNDERRNLAREQRKADERKRQAAERRRIEELAEAQNAS